MSGKRWTCAHDDHEFVHDADTGFTPCPACRPYPQPPIDWPARFRAAAEVADERYEASLHYALHSVGARLHEAAIEHPGLAEAIGRALNGEDPR